jgi:hypothetical protein
MRIILSLLPRPDIERSQETWHIYDGNTAVRYGPPLMRNKPASIEGPMQNVAVYRRTAKGWQYLLPLPEETKIR